MKLSDAIVLGSTITEPKAGNWNRCALGMAMNALGVPTTIDRPRRVCQLWPWLKNPTSWQPRYPVVIEIADLFDFQVCAKRLSLENLIRLVQEWEPECVGCGATGCTCKVERQLVPTMNPMMVGCDCLVCSGSMLGKNKAFYQPIVQKPGNGWDAANAWLPASAMSSTVYAPPKWSVLAVDELMKEFEMAGV